MTNQSIQQDTAQYQRDVAEFVNREVFYCVSHLISELSQDPSGRYIEEIMEFSTRPDYEECCLHEGYTVLSDGTVQDRREETDDDYPQWDSPEDCCYDENLNPYEYAIEAYEFWIVSDWLASRLEEKGHPVTHDFLGMTIWGRPTSGQAISMDGVICKIYNELQGA